MVQQKSHFANTNSGFVPERMTASPTADSSKTTVQVITVRVGDEVLCFDVLSVAEVVRLADLQLTRVPNAHDYVVGVANLRGKVLPVIDLARRLGLAAPGEKGRMVVVEQQDTIVGFTVDEVSEVADLDVSSSDDTAAAAGRDGTPVMIRGQIMTYVDVSRLMADVSEE